jgi:multimeric flavodoxin WrbA
MDILLITGTQHHGVTHKIKEFIISELASGNKITEFVLPKDGPTFCTGCKTCFYKDETLCPHADKVMPIWKAMLEADLILFVYPTYVMRAPAQVKALLDHLACHWMPHRPEPRLFDKQVAIIAQSLGAPTFGALRDVKVSMNWMGISSVKSLRLKLMNHAEWDLLSAKRRASIEARTRAFAQRFKRLQPAKKSLKHHAIFMMCRTLQQNLLKKMGPSTADLRHWLDKGWIRNQG